MDVMSIVQSPAFVWVVLAVIFGVIEAFTLGITCIWFAVGSIIAAIVALMGFSVPVQIIVALIVSIILLVATRPLVRKYVNSKVTATNIDALVGQKAIVVEPIPADGKGRVKVDGKLWSAQLADGTAFAETAEGSAVEITDVRGVTLIVKIV